MGKTAEDAMRAYQDLLADVNYKKYKGKLGELNPWIEGGDKKAVWNYSTINSYRNKLNTALRGEVPGVPGVPGEIPGVPGEIPGVPGVPGVPGDTTPAATATGLASEAEKKAQEALKQQQAQEQALMDAYKTSSQGIYDTSKTNASNLLTGSKSDIENLYNQGYTDLQNLTGQESEAAIKESLRPIEGKLQGQGLLGGPSGALNEALAGASERVRNAAISRLADYQTQKTGALANVYGGTASQLAGLESAYGTQSQGLLSSALQQALATGARGTDIAEKYGLTGLEAALGTNKLTLETAATKDINQQQADLQAEATAAAEATKAAQLRTAQDAWDRQYQSTYAQLYANMRAGGMMDAQASATAKAQTLNQIGQRP